MARLMLYAHTMPSVPLDRLCTCVVVVVRVCIIVWHGFCLWCKKSQRCDAVGVTSVYIVRPQYPFGYKIIIQMFIYSFEARNHWSAPMFHVEQPSQCELICVCDVPRLFSFYGGQHEGGLSFVKYLKCKTGWNSTLCLIIFPVTVSRLLKIAHCKKSRGGI